MCRGSHFQTCQEEKNKTESHKEHGAVQLVYLKVPQRIMNSIEIKGLNPKGFFY